MKQLDLLKSSVGKVLFFKTLPLFLGIFASIAYNLVDTFFVGRLGTNELAAMSFGFPIVMIVMNIIFGIAVAATSVISKAIGEKNSEKASNLTKKSIQLSLIFSAVFTLFGFFTINPLFSLLGADSSLLPLIEDYMLIWYVGIVFLSLSVLGGALFRARGNVLFPSMILLLGAVLNAVLDPILIFGWGFIPAMGIKGAALTTIFGNAFSAIIIFWRLKKVSDYRIVWFDRHFDFSLCKKILYIALPSALANSLVPFSTAVTNKMLSGYGPAAVAGNSIATRIETVPFMAIFALGSVIVPFVGQNWGAKQYARIREAVLKSFAFSYILGLISGTLFILYKSELALVFDSNPAVIEITSIYFSLIPYTYGVLGTVFLTNQILNGLNQPITGNFLSSFRLILLYLPLAFLLQSEYGVTGIFGSRLIANLSTGALATFFVWKHIFRNKELQEPADTAITDAT